MIIYKTTNNIIAARTNYTNVIVISIGLLLGGLTSLSMFFAFTIFRIKYCPNAYIAAIPVKRATPQNVAASLLTISATVLIRLSIISAAITIKNMTKNFLLSYFSG